MTTSKPSVARAKRLDQIVGATARLFAQYGYRRTAMDDIAREAGVAKATLYLHFGGKEDVFRAMATRFRDVVDAACAEAEQLVAPPQARLLALLDAYFGQRLDWFGNTNHLAELRALSSEEGLNLGPNPTSTFEKRLRRMLEDAASAAELDFGRTGLSPAQVARTLMHAAEGAKQDRRHTSESYRAELLTLAVLTCAALTS
jgi:AcrR family transcriptional regulator